MQDIFGQFSFTINKLNKLMQRVRGIEMRKYGLKTVHAMCLYYLNEHADGLTATQLARLTLEDKAAISRAVVTLRERGFVDCVLRRNHPVRLTEEGKAFAEHVANRAHRVVEACNLRLPPEERAFFFDCLTTVSERLQRYYEELIQEEDRQEDDHD